MTSEQAHAWTPLRAAGTRWIAPLGRRAPTIILAVLALAPAAGLLGTLAVGGWWSTDFLMQPFVLAYMAGPLLFGVVAAYGSVHVLRGREPPAGGWVFGTYVAVPVALTVATLLLEGSIAEGAVVALAVGASAALAAVPYAIGSIPFLWPGRTPSPVAFGLVAVGVLVTVPYIVTLFRTPVGATPQTPAIVIASLAQVSVNATLLAAVLFDGLTHRDQHPPGEERDPGQAAGVRRRWLVRLSWILAAGAAAWFSLALAGLVYRARTAAESLGPVLLEPVLLGTIGYLLGMGVFALVLASWAAASDPRPVEDHRGSASV